MANKGLRPALLLAVAALGAGIAAPARADDHHFGSLEPGNLLVSRSVYGGAAALLTPGTTVLPPGCTQPCANANADGSYPTVFNNDIIDPSFGDHVEDLPRPAHSVGRAGRLARGPEQRRRR